MPSYTHLYDTGHARVTDADIMEWYVHAKNKASITYFEGGAFSLYLARKAERKDVLSVANVLDTLADEGRVVLVHHMIEEGRWEYIAQRVPAYRMADNHRRERWAVNLPLLEKPWPKGRSVFEIAH